MNVRTTGRFAARALFAFRAKPGFSMHAQIRRARGIDDARRSGHWLKRSAAAPACILTALCLLSAGSANANPFTVIEELLVPGGPSVTADAPIVTDSAQLSGHSFRFSGRSDADGGGLPIQNVVPLEALGLPEGFGLVLDQSSDVPAFEGVTYLMSDTVRIDATWGFGDQPRSVEGFVDLHLGF